MIQQIERFPMPCLQDYQNIRRRKFRRKKLRRQKFRRR